MAGGIQRLTDTVGKRLKSAVLLESPVVRVARNADGTYKITARRLGAFADFDFDLVVLALPNYWLQRIEFLAAEIKNHPRNILRRRDRARQRRGLKFACRDRRGGRIRTDARPGGAIG